MNRIIVALLVTHVCAGCGGDDPAWLGKWAATGTWDVSGPLADSRTVGDAVADILVAQIVSLTGVPSVLEDKAHEYVDKAIRPHVKSVVDGNAPAELNPGGSVYQVLAASLASVRAESTIELEEGLLPGSMKGNEVVTAVEYQHDNKAYRLAAADLAGAGVTIEAEWEGKEDGDNTLEVDPHGVEIHFGELVRRVADNVIDAAGQTKLKDDVHAAISCDQIVSLILGGGSGLEISLSDWSYTVSDAALKKACGDGSGLVQSKVLGMFALDTLLEVGGEVTWTGDGEATGLQSAPGFGGIVRVAPPAIAPRVTVSFTAKRP